MKDLVLPFTLFLLFFGHAQSGRNVEKGLFKLNALLPGASYELGVANNISLNFDVFLAPFVEENFFGEEQFGILPGLQAEFRHFTSFKRRRARGKNLSGNSSDYVGVVNQFYSGNALIGNLERASSFYNATGIVYGIQRTAPRGFYWNLSFGPAILIDEFDTGSGIFIDAKLGWVIRKRK
ncbi:MAG: hypothetical protein AAFX53_07530 [Bacteroidota bacterium]